MLLQASTIISLVVGIVLFVYVGQVMAKTRGLDPLFWGVMGGLLGPLMCLFILFAGAGTKDRHCDHC